MTNGATVPVAVVTSRFEAELAVGLLRDHGLRAAVAADDAGGQEPQLQLQGVRILVAAADEDAARRILAAADNADDTETDTDTDTDTTVDTNSDEAVDGR